MSTKMASCHLKAFQRLWCLLPNKNFLQTQLYDDSRMIQQHLNSAFKKLKMLRSVPAYQN